MKQKSLLRSLLLLCALIVGSGSVWAEEVSIASFIASDYNGGTTNDWTVSNADYATAGGGYYKLISSDASIVSPSIDWSNYSDITITISARKFGGPNETQGKISVSQGEVELATYSPSGTSIVASSALSISPTDGTITISCPGASSSKGCGVQSIVIKGKTSSGGDIQTVATPTFSPAAGTFSEVQNVTISTTTEDATIYYTIDGNDPTTSSDVYSSAITVSETTTIKAMAVKDGMNNSAVATATYTINLPYSGDGYVRISSLDDLTDGAKVIIAARYNTTANEYYAMTAAVTGKPTGVAFTSTTTSKGEELPSDILNAEDTYYWTVEVTSDGCIFTNSSNKSLGYTSGTSFAEGGDNTTWVITRGTSGSAAMVSGYEGFYFTNKTKTDRGIALNSSYNYGPYSTGNNNSSGYNFYLDIFVEGATPVIVPSISAGNVEIAYDATSGEIAYSIVNPVDGTTLTAATEAEWISDITVAEDKVTFTTTANEGAERTATITLTYGTLTKDVTITQAGNPNIVDNISDITEVGTAYTVRGTVVATNARGFVIGDGTGYVYYYKNAAPTQEVGDMVTISGTTGTYGHIIQFTNSATVAEATASNYDNTPAAEAITEVPDYSEGYHLSTYLEFEGALSTSNNNYFITLGEEQIQISYPTDEQKEALGSLVDKNVHVKGYFSGINSSSKFSVMLESVEEVVSTEPSITVSPTTIEAPAEGAEGSLSIDWENIDDPIFDIIFTDESGEELEGDDPDWINVAIEENDGDFFVNYVIDNNEGEARTAYMKVYTFVGEEKKAVYSDLITFTQEEYVAPGEVSDYIRILSLDQLTDGSKVIIAARSTEEDATAYFAMTNAASGKPSGVEFNSTTISDGQVVLPSNIANNEDLYYWTVNVTADGYTFTNANGLELGYSSSTNFATGGNNTEWTIERSTSEETAMVENYTGFVIKNFNTPARGIAFNGQAFGAYANNNMAGSGYNFFLDLFVQDAPAPVATITLNDACTDGEMVYGTYSNSNAFVVSDDIVVSEIGIDANGKLVVESYATGDVVPANTGVMVAALEGGDYTVEFSTEPGTSVLGTDNCLRPSGDAGITANEMAAADANSLFYRLTMHNGEMLGFWWGAAEGAAFALAANKAYLTVPVNAARPGFVLGGETTAISGMKSEVNENAPVYNMQGQRVAQPAKGLYIVNGKKYINK